MMGNTVIENSKSEKYLGDQIHEDICEASIAATLDGRISGAIKAGEQIIRALNHPATMGHKMAEAAVEEYAMRVSSKYLSWIFCSSMICSSVRSIQLSLFEINLILLYLRIL